MRSIVTIVAAAALSLGVAACDQGTEEAEVPVEEELEGTVEPQEQIGEEPAQPLEEEGALEEEPLQEPAETAD